MEASGEIATSPALVHLIEIQKTVAAETGCAFFNTFEAMGGPGNHGQVVQSPASIGERGFHASTAGGRGESGLALRKRLGQSIAAIALDSESWPQFRFPRLRSHKKSKHKKAPAKPVYAVAKPNASLLPISEETASAESHIENPEALASFFESLDQARASKSRGSHFAIRRFAHRFGRLGERNAHRPATPLWRPVAPVSRCPAGRFGDTAASISPATVRKAGCLRVP